MKKDSRIVSGKKIGFDLDDVLLNFSDSLRGHMNQKYGKSIKREDLTTFYIEEIFGITSDDSRSVIDSFFFHDDHAQSLPMDGAQKVVEKLSANNKLYIITAKPSSLEKHTAEWLEEYFPAMFEKVHFANFFDTKEKRRKKSEICIELGIEIFIDDSIDNAHDVSSVGIPVLLFDAPWNQTDELPPLVTRVRSWEEIDVILNT